MALEINKVENLDSTEQKQYVENTTLQQHHIEIEETLETGTVKITEELFKQAVFAVDSRIKATQKYTENRIARINKNYELYEDQLLPTIQQSVDDWTDKLYKIFADFGDALKIKTEGPALDDFISKTLAVSPKEDTAPKGRLRSLLAFLLKEKFVEKSVYYFNKQEVIKSFLKRCITKAEVKEKIEEFIRKGVISGMFCFKEGWGENKDYKVTVNKTSEGSKAGKEYVAQGAPQFTIDSEPIYKLSIPDARNLIFRPDKKEWVMERIPTNFWKLLEDSLDENGKAKKNAVYDVAILNEIKKILKDTPNVAPKQKDGVPSINFNTELNGEEDMSRLYELEADLEVIESFNIPLVLSGKPTKCIVTSIYINEVLYPIRIQATSFVRGGPIDWEVFLPKKGDIGGKGLPEKLESLDQTIQEFNLLLVDNVRFAIYGITAGDTSHFKNPEKLKNLQPRDHIHLKDMKGRSIKEVFEWLSPPTKDIAVAFDIMKFYMDFLTSVSRKGPGDKITPNPSATEATVIMDAKAEPINTVGMRLNNYFGGLISNMYFYTLLNRDSRFALNVLATKITKENTNLEKTTKQVELARDELLIEGIQFEVEAMQFDQSRQAVQKQQYMQAIQLLWKTIGVTEQGLDPATGQPKSMPKVYVDETGNEVELNQFKIITDYLDKMGISDAWKMQEKPQAQPSPSATSMPSLPAGGGAQAPKGGVSAPGVNQAPLNASPTNAAVLNSAIQQR